MTISTIVDQIQPNQLSFYTSTGEKVACHNISMSMTANFHDTLLYKQSKTSSNDYAFLFSSNEHWPTDLRGHSFSYTS